MTYKTIKLAVLLCIIVATGTAEAQTRTLTLDSCRAMALRWNKQLQMARVEREMAADVRKAARTKYLPHVDLNGGYMYTSRSISILNDYQKGVLGNLGTLTGAGVVGAMPQLTSSLTDGLKALYASGQISMETLQNMGLYTNVLGQSVQGALPGLVETMNKAGQSIVDAFNTNTHHLFTASAMLTMPLYAGGVIKASNNMADIAVEIAEEKGRAQENNVTYDVERAYWLVVSLTHKKELADSFLELVKKLNKDVHIMIREGVATRADGLKVDVAENEADMTKTKVENGLSLARMLLCQLCGMRLDSEFTLETKASEATQYPVTTDGTPGFWDLQNRPELQMLSHAVSLSKEKTKIARAGYLPQVGLTGGAVFTNPSVFNSFERKFKGMGVVGVVVRIPVLDWGETAYRVRASKKSTTLAQLTHDEVEEKMQLEVSQCNYKLNEAHKQLVAATKNVERAEENLRCANLGFQEGEMQTTDVMAAQTAWLQAQTDKIDAEIDIRLSEAAMKKALGK